MYNRELDGQPRKRYMLRLSTEERKLLDIKAEQYGYTHLSEYIRDAAIYENIIQINVSYTDEVADLFQEYINEIRKYTKEVRRVLKYDTSMSMEEKNMLQDSLYKVYSQTKSLKKSVNDNLDVEEIIKQSKERLFKQKLEEIRNEYEINLGE